MKRLVVALLVMVPQMAAAATAKRAPPVVPVGSCLASIDATPRSNLMPVQLLRAVATVESGRLDVATHRVTPWPWTINVNGVGYFYGTKAQAVAAVQFLQAAGISSIDVGCMQINLMYHPTAFASLDAAFEPATNIAYAVRFLSSLYRQTGSWPKAAAAYHSQTPEIGADYEKRILAAWPMAPGVVAATAAAAPVVEVAEAPDPTAPTPEMLKLRQQMQADHAGLLKQYGTLASAERPDATVIVASAPMVRRQHPARSTGVAVVPRRTDALLRLADSRWLDGVIRN